MPQIAIFDWSLYTLPPSVPMSNIETDSHPNNPANPGYDAGDPTWLGATFTFNGGDGTVLDITDDDGAFEDAYVETGGSQTLAQAVTINGTTYPAGSVVQNEFSMLDGSGNQVWVVRIGDDNVGFAYEDGNAPGPGDSFTGTIGRDGAAGESDDATSSSFAYSGINADPVCYAPGTRILTEHGEIAVEKLTPGVRLVTADNGLVPLIWIGRSRHAFPPGAHKHKPIQVKPGAFAVGRPKRTLVVSPQHRVLFSGTIVQRLFGTRDVLAVAKGLTGHKNVRVMNGKREIEYYSLLCRQHQLIVAEGIWAESFFPGSTALDMIGRKARREVELLLPSVAKCPEIGYGPPVRRVLNRKESERLVAALQGSHRDSGTPKPAKDLLHLA